MAGEAVTVKISDAAGNVVRTLRGTAEAGLNRVWWDLEGENSTPVRMRTTPMYAEWMDLGPERVRVIDNGMSVLQPPGTYTVTLDVDGQASTASLEVRKDPNSAGTLADIRAQTALLEEMRGEHDRAAKAINQIEWVRRQLQDLKAVLADQGGAGDLIQAATALENQFIAVEEELTQLRTTGTGQDGVRYESKLIERLGHLAGGVSTSDFRPTDQQGQVNVILLEVLTNAEAALEDLTDDELTAFNRMLRERGLNPLIS
jgi:hypothetical protein